LGLALLPITAHAAYRAETPPDTQISQTGADGRFLMDGTWLTKRDKADKGKSRGWARQTSDAGWDKVTVPNAWNANDDSSSSMAGSVVWYRKDFKVPDKDDRLTWKVYFESIRYRADVYLNGRLLNSHDGGYVPFEVKLDGIQFKKVNRLVVRVDNRRQPTDLPPSRVTITGAPSGGWWNYGGLLGDVYLRRINRLDFGTVLVRPILDSRAGPAHIQYTVPVANYGKKPLRVNVTSNFGFATIDLGKQSIGPGRTKTFTGTLDVTQPHLWSPGDPFLYPVRIEAKKSRRTFAAYNLSSGIRSIKVVGGRLLLNDLPVNLRGGFVHQDAPNIGGAVNPTVVMDTINRLKQVGGTILRTHYPFSPLMHELADKSGVLLWSEIPVYQVPTAVLKKKAVMAEAESQLKENITAFENHPSVLTWSLGNELAPEPTSVERKWFDRGARIVKTLDPTRPVSLAIQGYPGPGCQSAYQSIQLLGVNDYFGWYPGPGGSIADEDQLSSFLDSVRACYPTKGIMITEVGAEANRDGPFEERGTYEFQSDFLAYHFGVYATKPWLSGAITMLQDFWCRPGWTGGNPVPQSPVHQKGVFDLAGNAKPAAAVVSDWFHRTQQYDLPGPP
jgi:beta-glucuronidase